MTRRKCLKCHKPAKVFKRGCYCVSCSTEYMRQHYKKNRSRYLIQVRANGRRKKKEVRTWLYNYLLEHPCTDCGEGDPVVLEFDHVRGKKFKDIAYLCCGSHSLKTVQQEVAKCDVCCRNCHMRRTAKRGGFWKAAFAVKLA